MCRKFKMASNTERLAKIQKSEDKRFSTGIKKLVSVI